MTSGIIIPSLLLFAACSLPAAEIHRWTFDGDPVDSTGSLELALTNGAFIADGHLVLDGLDDFAVTPAPLATTLGERTFIAWVAPSRLNQAGGGVLTVVGTTAGIDTFDGIVFGEQAAGQWMNGSNTSTRTVTNNGGPAETVTVPGEVMIAIVYGPGNAITIYRDGVLYSTAGATKGSLITYAAGTGFIHLGQRHPNTTNANRFFAGRINEARIHDTALGASEIGALQAAGPVPDTPVPAAAIALTSLTPGALVRQSSTFPTILPDRTDAGIAIDQNLSPANRTATGATDSDPWLEIELPRDALIDRVELLNLNLAPAASFRSRLRDITIEIKDAGGATLATSPLLNPGNAGFTFPNGPLSLAHSFALATPARFVRVRRTSDPDLSGTGGQGDPNQEANILALREVIVLGTFADSPELSPFSATFDSRRANPDPVSQLWFDLETVVGGDGSPADGLVNGPANVGLVVDGTETVWQTNDQLAPTDRDNPRNQNLLAPDELRDLFELGWTFSVTLKPVSPSSASLDAGFTGWGFTAGQNPGWDIGANSFARIGFFIGRGTDQSLRITPQNQPPVTLAAGSGNDYHTITAVCPPRATEYEWFIDGVSQGTIDFAEVNVGGETLDVVTFGSGASAPLGRVVNWKNVSLTTIDPPAAPSLAGLLFYLPFEPGPAGNETLVEKSRAPGAKPAITERNGLVERRNPAAAGQGVFLPGAVPGPTGPFLDASPAVPALATLDTVTLSVWVKVEFRETILSLSDSSDSDSRTVLRVITMATTPHLEFSTTHDGTAAGDVLLAPTPDIQDGFWHHVAVTLSPAAATLYYDGRIIDTASPGNVTRFADAIPDLDTFGIGSLVTSAFPDGSGFFRGGIDELSIWNRALSGAEITSLYHRGYLGAPLSSDRDGDGLNAAEESALGTRDDSSDSDGDTLGDAEEIILRTDPTKADTDGDGISDADEIANGTNALLADSDGDGFSDGAETLPARLVSRSFSRAPDGTITFVFQSFGAATNLRLESATNLLDFAHLPGVVIVHSGGGLHTATATPPPGQRFFRAVSDEGAATDPLDPSSFQDHSSPDSDGDGLTDAAESTLGTDPGLPDSDSDTFSDFVEVLLGTDPKDPLSKPGLTDSDNDGLTDAQEAGLGTNPNLADSDNDTFSDHAEVNAGSDPKSGASVPGSAVLTTVGFVLQQNGDILFNFRVQGNAPNLRLQSSSDLAGFPDLGSAVITPLGGGLYQATATPPPGHRFFRAAADDGGGGTTTTIAVEFDLPAGLDGSAITSFEAGEGSTFTRTVLFSSPFTGYLSFTVTGTTPDGALLPPVHAGLALTAATSAQIPLHLFNDLAAGATARYTVTLSNNPGLVTGLNPTFTLTVTDDDSIWNGTLGVGGEQLGFMLESFTDGTTILQHLVSPESSGLLPRGTFPVTASFGQTLFNASAGNIPLLRELTDITAGPATITSLQLTADDALPGQSVAPGAISGGASFSLTPPAGSPATFAGTFNLQRQPPPPPSTDLNLTPSP